MAPVATAMWGGKNLSGFDDDELFRRRGEQIDWVNVQFYSGSGSAATVDDYVKIIERGVYPPEKVVLGVIGNPIDGEGYVDVEQVAETVRELTSRYPHFGGVDVWGYFRALPGDHAEPWKWIELMSSVLDRPSPAR